MDWKKIKKPYVVAGSILAGLLLVTGLVLLLRGCGREKGPAVPAKDYESAYQAFLDGGFASLDDATRETAAWMGRFIADGNEERIEEVQGILDSFLQMKDFFARDFPSDRSFRSQMKYMGKRFTGSPYPVVRKTWQRVSSRATDGKP